MSSVTGERLCFSGQMAEAPSGNVMLSEAEASQVGPSGNPDRSSAQVTRVADSTRIVLHVVKYN